MGMGTLYALSELWPGTARPVAARCRATCVDACCIWRYAVSNLSFDGYGL